jgi:hypothetical protein
MYKLFESSKSGILGVKCQSSVNEVLYTLIVRRYKN